jgi:hypothetical protein
VPWHAGNDAWPASTSLAQSCSGPIRVKESLGCIQWLSRQR